MSRLTSAARICFDLLIFAGLCVLIYAFEKWIPAYKRGFFCNDESLQYPYKPSTVGLVTLLVIILSVPGSIIAVVELFKRREPVKKSAHEGSGCGMGRRLAQCYAQLGYYLFGMAIMLIATETAKCSVGRLRPHFFAVCQPQMPDGSSCADAHNLGRYIQSYSCLGAANYSAQIIKELNLSFPSGHASLIFYAMFYVAIYIQAALSTRISKLFKHLLQFACAMCAWFVALTRISDYWHHWSDVLVGAALGLAFAYLVAVYVAKLFVPQRKSHAHYGAAGNRIQVKATASTSSSAKSQTPVLPAYTFGSVPYLAHPAMQVQYGQSYHNYGYVP